MILKKIFEPYLLGVYYCFYFCCFCFYFCCVICEPDLETILIYFLNFDVCKEDFYSSELDF
jgi:hypothetical protein